MVFYPAFVADAEVPTISDVVEHVRYITDLVGVEHVGIGPDFIGMIDASIWRGASFHGISDDLMRRFPTGLETVAHLHALRSELGRSGFSDTDVELVMGGNFARVFRAVLPGRT